jgi:hypothetical protein
MMVMQYDDGMDTVPARLTVERNLPIDTGHRQIILSVDGTPLATLLNGQYVTREITPGTHSLRGYNTLVRKTVEFDAAPGEHVEFVTANRASKWTFSALALMGVGPVFLVLERKATPSTVSPA